MAFIPTDTNFPDQTYLRNPLGPDLNIVDAWDHYTGAGVEVVVFDSGFDYNHMDFTNYRTDLDWDFVDNDNDALFSPDPDLTDDNDVDFHGTNVMGGLGAAVNGVGSVGVAFDADLIGYKRGGWSTWDDALNLATTRNHDVFNISAGVFTYLEDELDDPNGSEAFLSSGTLTDMVDALENAIENGRVVQGIERGLVVVKSAGNARFGLGTDAREETTAEAMDSHRGTITVAGTEADGFMSEYSSPGASVLVSAFYYATDVPDITGAQGKSSGDFMNFAGTSISAPMVAGVTALMLEANPELGWRDVQTILAYSARHTGSDVGAPVTGWEQATFGASSWAWNGANDWNGGGLHVSNDYGFGLVDAEAAVRLAETWQGSNHSFNEVGTFADALDREVIIGSFTAGGTRSFQITERDGIDIEHVTLSVNFVRLDDQDDLSIWLTSPAGTRIQMIAQTGDDDGFSGTWDFGATGFRGESSQGNWLIEVSDRDEANFSPIIIDDITLRTHGALANNNDLFIFTNEYSDYVGNTGHGSVFHGGTGIDTINTAAVDVAVVIDLDDGTGNIDFVDVVLSSIERVYTGIWADTITDGPGAQDIHAGRGNDRVTETNANGTDRYFLGEGDDQMTVFSAIGSDEFHGGPGRDTISFRYANEVGATFNLATERATDANGNEERMFSFENLIGTENADTIVESGASNTIVGLGGDDTVIVTTLIVDDSFDGGDGFNDLIDWSGSAQGNGFYNLESGRAVRGGFSEHMANFEDFIGTDQNDIVVESAPINEIDLRAGNDTLRVNTSIFGDSFDGGIGTDTIDWSGSTQDGGTYDLDAGTAVIGSFSETMRRFENFIGTHQDDIVIESLFANEIDAGAGDDTVRVITAIGVDSFTGGFGTDTIDWSGSAQADGIYDLSGGTARNAAGTQTETMFGFENFIGTAQSDHVIEGVGLNIIQTGAGTDRVEVHSGIGGDSFDGGAGFGDLIDWSGSAQSGGTYDLAAGLASVGDVIETMTGFEDIIGTNQRDLIRESTSANDINGGGGDDTVFVTSLIASDSFTGGFGTDTIDWSGSAESGALFDLSAGTATNAAGTQTEIMFGFEDFIGTEQRDILVEGAGTNRIDLGGGHDELRVGTAIDADSYSGGAGLDLIDWSALTLEGARFDLGNGFARLGSGREDMDDFESLHGTQGDDEIFGSAGSNGLRGFAGDDRISARNGDDRAYGGEGNDFVRGQGGNDQLLGEDGDDRLFGNNGNDELFGGNGSDRVVDGPGGDRLHGGGGDDLFVIVTDLATDRIADFEHGLDRIRLFNVGFDDLVIDDLANGNVRIRYDGDVLILEDPLAALTAVSFSEADFIF